MSRPNPYKLAIKIKQIGKKIGFDCIGITNPEISCKIPHFKAWLKSGYYGDMHYFEKHSEVYQHPEKLLPNVTRIISCSIRYPISKSPKHPIASFAQFEDYSNKIRALLKQYVAEISHELKGIPKTRVFAGNAPILEKALAAKAGLGWYGKNSILLNEKLGSYFFLGEILTDLPLPIDKPTTDQCGNCFKCQTACPTSAIIGPYNIDARRCIAYLTIEHKGSIPVELRPLIGTKVFGCDICQQVCPWNFCGHREERSDKAIHKDVIKQNIFRLLCRYAPHNDEEIRKNLIVWFLWNEEEFKTKTKDSPINRICHERWLRNLAVALGNSIKTPEIISALNYRLEYPSELVREHIKWALNKLIKTA